MKNITIVITFAVSLILLTLPVQAQINMPCTSAMITSFTPCMNFVTNSSANGASPIGDCCNTLKTLMANSTGCLCLLLTGGRGIPALPFPINRTLSMSLPSICNMPSVPLLCRSASGAPGPSPGSGSVSPTPAPGSDEVQAALPPPSPAVNSGAPATNPRNPSPPRSSSASSQSQPLLALFLLLAYLLEQLYI